MDHERKQTAYSKVAKVEFLSNEGMRRAILDLNAGKYAMTPEEAIPGLDEQHWNLVGPRNDLEPILICIFSETALALLTTKPCAWFLSKRISSQASLLGCKFLPIQVYFAYSRDLKKNEISILINIYNSKMIFLMSEVLHLLEF